jgi:hypothetical protein
MPRKGVDRYLRVKAVEREYKAARVAVDHLLDSARHDSSILRGKTELRDVRHMSGLLEGTYLIRLFAEFETGLRLFWHDVRTTSPPARTRDLLDGVASTCKIPHDELNAAHSVREYRNSLVHERDDTIHPIPIEKARDRLCKYFVFVLRRW